MATTTITWRLSGSTYTINYPDGLFQEVCKASKYFTDTDKAYDENILLIPANGSKLDYCLYNRHTHVVKHKYSRSGECTTTTEDFDESVVPEPFEVWPNYSDIGRTYKNDLCKTMQPWMLFTSVYNTMSETEKAWEHKTGKSETLYTYNVSIEIYGTPNYFSSNAEFYYCWNRHLDEVATTVFDLQIYCASSYSSKKFVGGILVMDGDNVVDMGTTYIDPEQQLNGTYQYGTNQLWFQRLDLNRFPAGGENTPSYGPFQQTSFRKTPMRTEECTVYDGFTFNWYPSIGEFLPPPKPYSLQGKRIRFIFDELVAISTGMCLYIEAFILQPGEKVEGDDKPPKPQIKRQIVRTNIDPENEPHPEIELTETGKKMIFPFPNYDEWRKEKAPTAPQFIFTTRKRVKDLYNNIHYSWTQGANLMFNNLFTYYRCDGQTLIGDSESPPQFLVSPSPGEEYGDVPLYPAGLNLYPVFHPTPCTYFKLHSTQNCDKKLVFGNDNINKFHKDILDKLDKIYGKNGYAYINEKDWNFMTLDSKINQIKDNLSPLKIIHIACHGTKSTRDDKSGSVLSHTSKHDSKNNILNFKHLKSILHEAKPNEYYIIICTSCYGGGKFEDYIHNNVLENNYSIVDMSNDINANCFILYSDNANSPAWLFTENDKNKKPISTRSISHLIDFDDENTTYQEQFNEINYLVNQVRYNNLSELLDFMNTTYEFMRDKLLLSDADLSEGKQEFGHHWTADTHAQSTHNYKNLIFCASRQSDGGLHMSQLYPIVYCYLLLYNMPLCPQIDPDKPPVDRREFLRNKDFLVWYVHNFIRTIATMRSENGYVHLKKSIFMYLKAFVHTPPKDVLPKGWNENAEIMQTFQELVGFFYAIYKMQYNMWVNSQQIIALNQIGASASFLIDDAPGALLKGDDEFKNCKLFTYPGYSDDDGGISEESILRIIYKENPKKDEGES